MSYGDQSEYSPKETRWGQILTGVWLVLLIALLVSCGNQVVP